jgi:hypothetical protein
MLKPEDLNPENCCIHWPGVVAVQVVILIAVSIAVANHSGFTIASAPGFEAKHH